MGRAQENRIFRFLNIHSKMAFYLDGKICSQMFIAWNVGSDGKIKKKSWWYGHINSVTVNKLTNERTSSEASASPNPAILKNLSWNKRSRKNLTRPWVYWSSTPRSQKETEILTGCNLLKYTECHLTLFKRENSPQLVCCLFARYAWMSFRHMTSFCILNKMSKRFRFRYF